jgi:hypothetical protein
MVRLPAFCSPQEAVFGCYFRLSGRTCGSGASLTKRGQSSIQTLGPEAKETADSARLSQFAPVDLRAFIRGVNPVGIKKRRGRRLCGRAP